MIGKLKQRIDGFTLVELAIVIVVIGILAGIVILAYSNSQSNARLTVLKSDLSTSSDTLNGYAPLNNGTLPADLTSAQAAGVKNAVGTNVLYIPSSATSPSVTPQTFCLQETYGAFTYFVSSTVQVPTKGTCGPTNCPTNFIPVPGNATFGTSDFCIAKYEAKDTGGTPIVAAAGALYKYETQATALSIAPSMCTGCHVPTEAEWMTVAANVISMPINWSGGAVGTGYIYSGHNNDLPLMELPASTNDDNGYYQETPGYPNQKRTLYLSNGSVIWDIAGNQWEWTQGTVAANSQPGIVGEGGYTLKEWTNGSLVKRGIPASSYPSAVSAQAATWTSAQGIGELSSYYGETTVHAFYRGGSRNNDAEAGVLSLELVADTNTISWDTVGLRVTR